MLIGSVSPHTYTVIVGLLPVTEGTRIVSTQLNRAGGGGGGGGRGGMGHGPGEEGESSEGWFVGCLVVIVVIPFGL